MAETPNRVRELRSVIFKGQVSQKELAERAGIDQSTLSDIETQKSNNFTALTALSIARVLGVAVEDLFLPPSTDGASVEMPSGGSESAQDGLGDRSAPIGPAGNPTGEIGAASR